MVRRKFGTNSYVPLVTHGTAHLFGFGVQALVSWRSPLTGGHSRISRNQGSELPNATIVPQRDVVADMTRSD